MQLVHVEPTWGRDALERLGFRWCRTSVDLNRDRSIRPTYRWIERLVVGSSEGFLICLTDRQGMSESVWSTSEYDHSGKGDPFNVSGHRSMSRCSDQEPSSIEMDGMLTVVM